MPKSMNTALATIFASIVLGIEPVVSRPSAVLQRHFSGSSDLRTATVTGMGVAQVPRLFSNTHSPLLPSLNDTANDAQNPLRIRELEMAARDRIEPWTPGASAGALETDLAVAEQALLDERNAGRSQLFGGSRLASHQRQCKTGHGSSRRGCSVQNRFFLILPVRFHGAIHDQGWR
jgi:hypothetical protein